MNCSVRNLTVSTLRFIIFTAVAAFLFIASKASAQSNSLVALDTNGIVHTVNLSTGALTEKAEEILHNYSIGAIARRKNNLYYVAVPSGGTEQFIYKASLSTGVISKVELDLALGDDAAKALFFSGKKLYGVFYNSSAGTGGVYRINPTTGVTRRVIDLSNLDIEPIGGAIARRAEFFFLLGHPSSDSTRRSLIRFKLNGALTSFDVTNSEGAPVICDKLKLNKNRQDFICLASPSATQVDVCRLSAKGRATCLTTLDGVERVAGGHSLVTPNGSTYYAFVYTPSDENTQTLIKFNARGALKSSVPVSTIVIGARFGIETD